MNILLAIQQRTRSGEGVWLDIAMGENLLPMTYWALGEGELTGRFPGMSDALVTGGSARYQIYRTADDKFLSVAPIEERFWQNFCEVIDLPVAYRDDAVDPMQTHKAVAGIIASKPSSHWLNAFMHKDACVQLVHSVGEARQDPHFIQRGVYGHQIATDHGTMSALPVPIASCFRDPPGMKDYPRLDTNELY
jgi:crotonobetainyl-CoA:carnitine CoA-transferase CaiB-like acyl-CoA transferase